MATHFRLRTRWLDRLIVAGTWEKSGTEGNPSLPKSSESESGLELFDGNACAAHANNSEMRGARKRTRLIPVGIRQ